MTAVLRRAVEGVWWYLRTATGESRFDDHVARCAAEGVEPMSRRAFERHRDDLREHHPASRCC